MEADFRVTWSISIHLMLLFIYILGKMDYEISNFNTSHVTVYHDVLTKALAGEKYFNTSHVTVYHCLMLLFFCLALISIHLMLLFICGGIGRRPCNNIISIHLMLLFITDPVNVNTKVTNFNTSHVTVYQSFFSWLTALCFISIHLMLLFIPLSSYCPSDTFDFNTSHVTVYRRMQSTENIPMSFQYISCYCLSNELTPFYIFLRI